MIRLQAERKALFPRRVFRTARVERQVVENVFVTLEQDGVLGFGESSCHRGEEPQAAVAKLSALAAYFGRQTVTSLEDIRRIDSDIRERVASSLTCQCAVDVALWDLLARLGGKTVCEVALGRMPRKVATSVTLGLGPRSEWPERIDEVVNHPSIKVKLDGSADLEILKVLREKTPARVRVDANGSWSGKDLAPLSAELQALGVELIEQPLPVEEDHRMPAVLQASKLPVIADESCQNTEDVARLAGHFTGFNIKLVKCGGLTPALEMVELGRKLGLQIMVGCMLESSLSISAGLVVAQQADFADLDGSWLLADGPFEGLRLEAGYLSPGPGLGLGVSPRPAAIVAS